MPPRNAAAFSLIEVVVALALFAMVLTLSGLLLGGMGRVTEALQRPPPRRAADFVRSLEQDLDRIVQAPLPADAAGFRLEEAEGLSFPALLRDAANHTHSFRIHYRWREGGDIERIQTHLRSGTAETNTVLRSVRRFRILARADGETATRWPPEPDSPPPPLLQVELEIPGEAPLTRELFLPVAQRVVPLPTRNP